MTTTTKKKKLPWVLVGSCLWLAALTAFSLRQSFSTLVSLTDELKDAVTPVNQQDHRLSQRQTTTTTTVGGNQSFVMSSSSYNPRPFPRWGDTAEEEERHGLAMAPILDFILNSSTAVYSPKWPEALKSKAYVRTSDHEGHSTINGWFPETLYVVDADGLWTSGRHRNATGTGTNVVRDKLMPTERQAMEAWKILQHGGKAQADKDDDTAHRWPRLREWLVRGGKAQADKDDDDTARRWPRLHELLVRGGTKNNNNSNSSISNSNKAVGFPFLGWFGDYIGCNRHNWKKTDINYSIPLFTTAANVDCNFTFPFPTYQTSRDAKKSSLEWEHAMRDYQQRYPWERKRRQIVWRGGLTGLILNATHKSPRWNMVRYVKELKRQHEQQQQRQREEKEEQQEEEEPFLFDVGATRLPPRQEEWTSDLHEVGGLVEGISPMEDFQLYRGILDLDGNSWSSRFGALLCYNSVVLKVEPSYVDYFHFQRNNNDGEQQPPQPALQPWKHFVPVKADLSDLVEQARFVADPANDAVLQGMVAQANAWCRQHMVRDAVARDMLDIWERYVELLDRGSPGWDDDESGEWVAAKREIFAPESPLDVYLL